MKQQTLALCMIVKNEAANIENCLTKMLPLVDEAIVIDTGSTDDTVDIIKKKFPSVKLGFCKWDNNASRPRNVSLRMATSDWIISTDVDEIIAKRDHQKIRDLINKTDADGIVLLQRSYITNPAQMDFIRNATDYEEAKPYPGYIDTPFVRLFKNQEDIKYEGIVHELVDYSLKNKKKFYSDIPIHHTGLLGNKQKKNLFYLNLLEKEVELEPNLFKPKYILARQYFELEKYEESLNMFSQALQLRPHSAKVSEYMGLALQRLGRFEESIDVLLKALEIDSETHSAYTLLGTAFFHLDNLVKAEDCLKEALRLNPEGINEHNILGFILYKQQKYTEAETYLRRAIDLWPNFAQAHTNLFLTLIEANKIKEAIHVGKTAISLDKTTAGIINEKLNQLNY